MADDSPDVSPGASPEGSPEPVAHPELVPKDEVELNETISADPGTAAAALSGGATAAAVLNGEVLDSAALGGLSSSSSPPPLAGGATAGNGAEGILERQRVLRLQQLQKQQAQGRLRVKQQKLKMTFFGYTMVLIFFAALQFIGVVTFTQGFLLSRQVLPDVADSRADPGLAMAGGARFDKMVFLVVDALRFDFVVPVGGAAGGSAADDAEAARPYHNEMGVLWELFQQHPENALLLKFLADPPTTTLQRLKGLTTGSLPTFIDAGSNFDGDAIDEDNWLLQLYNHNKSIAFMGDDTWKALFTAYINPALFYPFDSLNVWDLHTVDNGVTDHMFPLLETRERQREWDVLIGHFLGVDHVGHRYGPDHPTMKPKLNQMDDVIRRVVDKLDDTTLLCVIGDHGMDATGNHGGDSKDELESTLFLYSKAKKAGFRRLSGARAGAAGAAGASAGASDLIDPYDVAGLGAKYRAVNQIDLVPTLSLLLGLPIPHNNLGSPIEEAFGADYAEASLLTTRQIQKFRTLAGLNTDEALNEMYEQVAEEAGKHRGGRFGGATSAPAVELSREFQATFLEQCKQMWATFDLKLIVIGVLTLVASLTFIVTYSRLIPSVRVSTMSFEFIGSVIAMILLGLVLSFSVYIVLHPAGFSLRRCIAIGSSIGIFVGLWAPIMDRFSVAWLWHQLHDFFIYNFNGWSVLAITFIVGHALIFASNSFVVWEDKMVQFFIQTFGFYCLAQCYIKLDNAQDRILGMAHSLTFLVLGRATSMVTLCREEQQPYCQSNFSQTWWAVAALYVLAVVLPSMIRSFYKLSDSYHSAAPLWIGTALTFLLFANAIYWTLEYLESNNTGSGLTDILAAVLQFAGAGTARGSGSDAETVAAFSSSASSWAANPIAAQVIARAFAILGSVDSAASVAITAGGPLIVSIKLAIARISMFITLVLANYSWSRGPLCVKLAEQAPEDRADSAGGDAGSSADGSGAPPKPAVTILGYKNVYGSSYFLLVLNFAVPIMLVTKPLGAVAIGVLLIQILTLLELYELLALRGNLIAPTMFGLLAFQYFFSTGHQATLQAIQWEVGFITTESITFPFTHLNLVLNTFGPFIIVAIAIPLITLWKIPPSPKPITVLSQIVTNTTSLLSYHTVISISSLAFAGHFRRHLMVWKIFAPRFMLSGILLLSTNVILIAITLWFGTGKLLTQINRIFGK